MKKVLIARATGSDGRPAVELSTTFEGELPTYEDHREHELRVVRAYRSLHARRPKHIGSATLPWCPTDEGGGNG